jgi:hypothetical protein
MKSRWKFYDCSLAVSWRGRGGEGGGGSGRWYLFDDLFEALEVGDVLLRRLCVECTDRGARGGGEKRGGKRKKQ